MLKAIVGLGLSLTMALTGPAPTVHKDVTFSCGTAGKKVPVVLVHGLTGSPDIWGQGDGADGTMVHALRAAIPDLYIWRFNYSSVSTRWVSDPNIGPALAQVVHCLAASSRAGGGIGKVIVVAHSMGGLAIRYALGVPVQGQSIAGDVGMVATIGTPNKGSVIANVVDGGLTSILTTFFGPTGEWAARCEVELLVLGNEYPFKSPMECADALSALRLGAAQLAALPHYPSTVPVFAVAGNVSLRLTYWGMTVHTQATQSDLVVGVNSALQEMQQSAKGGGTAQFGCAKAIASSVDVFRITQGVSCYHGALPQDSGVESQVAARIKTYLNSLLAPAMPTCATASVFQQVAKRKFGEQDDKVSGITCNSGWAFANMYVSSVGQGYMMILRQVNGTWVWAFSGSAAPQTGVDPVCTQLPPSLRTKYCVG